MRIYINAPHFGEYGLNMSRALAINNDVCLCFNSENMLNEVGPGSLQNVPQRLSLVAISRKNIFKRWIGVFKFLYSTFKFRPNVVHAHEVNDVLSCLAVSVLTLFYPVILTVHDPVQHSGRDSRIANYTRAAVKFMRRCVQGFHVHGEYCAQSLKTQEKIGTRSILSTQHGTILGATDSEKRSPIAGRVLLFGRMEAYKGVERFVETVRRIRNQNVQVTGVLAGAGTELIRLLPELINDDTFEIQSGYLTPSQARQEFQKAAIIVVPYRDATQSGVVSAAFANDRPVVATAVGGLVDSVAHLHNGCLVAPENIDQLESAIVDLITNQAQWKQLSEGAHRSALTDFSWPFICNQFSDFYLSLTRVAARHDAP